MDKFFSLPGYFEHYNDIRHLIEYRTEHPEYFYSDRIIDSAYGFPGGYLWNGGRVNTNMTSNIYILDEMMLYYHGLDSFHIKHTCTNMLITEELTHDWLCNRFLSHYQSDQDFVIINNAILKQYIETTFPKYRISYSTTLGYDDINIINEKSQNNILVLNYNYNNDNLFLSQLEHPQNIEILCAEPCIPHCPKRQLHYETLSRTQLHMSPREQDITACPYGCDRKVFTEIQQSTCAISNQRIEDLSTYGFKYFKLSGRNLGTSAWFEIILYYLVLPEYRDFVRQDFFRTPVSFTFDTANNTVDK